MDTNFLTAKDIANKLKISKALAYRLLSNGQIRSVRFGKTVRVYSQDLDAFLAQHASNQEVQPIPPIIPDSAPLAK